MNTVNKYVTHSQGSWLQLRTIANQLALNVLCTVGPVLIVRI